MVSRNRRIFPIRNTTRENLQFFLSQLMVDENPQDKLKVISINFRKAFEMRFM